MCERGKRNDENAEGFAVPCVRSADVILLARGTNAEFADARGLLSDFLGPLHHGALWRRPRALFNSLHFFLFWLRSWQSGTIGYHRAQLGLSSEAFFNIYYHQIALSPLFSDFSCCSMGQTNVFVSSQGMAAILRTVSRWKNVFYIYVGYFLLSPLFSKEFLTMRWDNCRVRKGLFWDTSSTASMRLLRS